MLNKAQVEKELILDMVKLAFSPMDFVMYAYPWDTDSSIQVVELPEPWASKYGIQYGPDKWACELLDRIGEQIQAHKFDGQNAVDPIREAVASGHGIGKSAMVGWIVDFIMSTRPFAQGTITANTSAQLETKTWTQIATWTKKCITAHWFRVTSGRGSMKLVRIGYESDWYCTAQTCREENSEAFAGQHQAISTSFYINDEASAIPASICEVQEGGLTDGEPMQFWFGNPTKNSGKFYDCFHSQRHRWNTTQVDSRDVQITNKTHLNEMVEDYGIDSDIVKVRIRGMFPSMSVKQFISVEDADAGYGKVLRPDQYKFAPKILCIDPAWQGDDDFVIGLRQGLAFKILRVIKKNDNDMIMATLIANLEDEHKADAVFIDAGYGTGIKSGGDTLHRNHWRLVWFGGKSPEKGCLNMRTYIWKQARDWLKAGGAYPANPTMHDDFIGPELIPRADGIMQLESKKDMKARGLPSPGYVDALAISFAYTVNSKYVTRGMRKDMDVAEAWEPTDYI